MNLIDRTRLSAEGRAELEQAEQLMTSDQLRSLAARNTDWPRLAAVLKAQARALQVDERVQARSAARRADR